MKKKSLIFGILLLGVVFTASQVSGTYARYITTDTAKGTATVAKWAVTMKAGDATMDADAGASTKEVLTLVPESSTDVVADKIAPSFTATGVMEINLTGTEVATDLEFTLGSITGLPASGNGSGSVITPAVKYATVATTDATVSTWTTLTKNGDKYILKLPLATVQSTPVIKLQVGILWDNAGDAHNADDTYNGINTSTITAEITATAKQHITSIDGAQS